MQPAEPVLPPAPRGVRDGLAALLFAVGGAALAGLVLAHRWPWVPPDTHRPDYAYNVRLLKLALLLEGGGLAALAVGIAWRGAWLRRLGGVAALEARAGVGLAILFVSHLVAFLFFFPPQQILSAEPVHTGAHLGHYYRIFAAHRLLSDAGRTWGYDPFFAAGYPAGAVFDADIRGAELFAHAAAFLGLPYATKAYVLLAHGLLPVVLYAAGRVLGLARSEALLAALAGTCVWHGGRPLVGSLRWLGMHSYLLACQLVVLGAAIGTRFFDRDHRVRALCLAGFVGIAAGLGFVQPAGLLLVVPPAVTSVVLGWARLRGRDRAALAGGAVLLAAVHATWALPFFRQRHLLGSEPVAQLGGALDLLDLWLRPGALPAVAVLLLGGAGVWLLRRRAGLAAATITASLGVWLAAAALGGRLGALGRIENARALVACLLLAALPAGVALRRGLAAVQPALGAPLVLAATLVAATLPPFLSCLDARFFAVHRLDATLDRGFYDLVAALDAAAPTDARVLFESTTNARTPLSDGFPLEALVPIHTRRELLGSPQPGMPFAPPGLGFGSGELGGRGLESWTAAEFAAFLERYNVGAVAAWSAPARAFLARQTPLVESAASLHGFDLYRCARPSGWFTQGAAEVRADYGRIALAAVRGEVLGLKYHWLDGLRATPPVVIEPMPVPGEVLPFIRVYPAGATQIVLWSGR